MTRAMTVEQLHAFKRQGRKIVALTAYDYSTAVLVDRAGVDVVLVGDSLSMVMLGFDGTRPVSIEAMLHHTAAVRRGITRAMLWGDLPHEAFQGSPEETAACARRFFEEAGVDAIKLEGAREMQPVIEAVVAAGLPLVGHVGLKPQSVAGPDDFKVQGKDADAAKAILDDAKYLEEAGAFAIVLECIPHQLAALISQSLTVPTIGIGAGPDCDGQVQVIHDILGLVKGFHPKHAKKYVDLASALQTAVEDYRSDVVDGRFPAQEHSFRMNAEEWERLRNKQRE